MSVFEMIAHRASENASRPKGSTCCTPDLLLIYVLLKGKLLCCEQQKISKGVTFGKNSPTASKILLLFTKIKAFFLNHYEEIRNFSFFAVFQRKLFLHELCPHQQP